jgi:hypothetical protein
MSTTPVIRRATARRRAPAVAAACACVLVLLLPACRISWSLGATHGAIIEPSAGRANIGVWRAPSRVLYDVFEAGGIDPVQDLLCHAGRFPTVRVAVGKLSISSNVLQDKWCGYVYGDDADLRGALIDAQRGRRDDCLALTLISRGAYIKNWTHKDAGCKTGALR